MFKRKKYRSKFSLSCPWLNAFGEFNSRTAITEIMWEGKDGRIEVLINLLRANLMVLTLAPIQVA